MADLFSTLQRLQIQPIGPGHGGPVYVEHRSVKAVTTERADEPTPTDALTLGKDEPTEAKDGIRSGDRVVIRYLDDNKVASFTLSKERHDPINGILSVASPLGSQLIGCAEEDEAEFEVDGRTRRILIVHGATGDNALTALAPRNGVGCFYSARYD